MRQVIASTPFKKDAKRYKRHKNVLPTLDTLVGMLAAGQPLPSKHRDHALKGRWIPGRECHVLPDVLLVYEITETAVKLVRLGSHAELFGL